MKNFIFFQVVLYGRGRLLHGQPRRWLCSNPQSFAGFAASAAGASREHRRRRAIPALGQPASARRCARAGLRIKYKCTGCLTVKVLKFIKFLQNVDKMLAKKWANVNKCLSKLANVDNVLFENLNIVLVKVCERCKSA